MDKVRRVKGLVKRIPAHSHACPSLFSRAKVLINAVTVHVEY